MVLQYDDVNLHYDSVNLHVNFVNAVYTV